MTTYEVRRQRARALMREAGIGAVAFVPGPNFTYLTGVHLHLMERPTLYLLTGDGRSFGLMPGLERQKWGAAMPGVETVYWEDRDGPADAFARIRDMIGQETVGVEGLRMRAAEYRALSRCFGEDALVDADQSLAELRLLKDEAEISELRRAIAISEASLGETLAGGIGGRTGREIETRLKAAMLSHGATGFAFDPIVLSGGETANPHGDVSDRIVHPGDALLIDFGASWGEMHADITRTFFCGHVTDEDAAIYETVLAANAAGRAAVRAGDPVGAVDDAATSILEASPFHDLILHKTGHGLGREVHEAPAVMRSNRTTQREGMVFTIEPGLYRPGEIGIRIEDNVVVNEAGLDCLTTFNRDLVTHA